MESSIEVTINADDLPISIENIFPELVEKVDDFLVPEGIATEYMIQKHIEKIEQLEDNLKNYLV